MGFGCRFGATVECKWTAKVSLVRKLAFGSGALLEAAIELPIATSRGTILDSAKGRSGGGDVAEGESCGTVVLFGAAEGLVWATPLFD